jgi:beta-lactamase regulating signal transducer with metallopeptidase domain/uncharacterized protein YjbI with pentapeptide repeats
MNLDLALCGRLCLVLGHSLWQFALLAAGAAFVARLWKKAPPERIYSLCVVTMVAGMMALPLTFLMTRVSSDSLATRAVINTPQQIIPHVPNSPQVEQQPVQQAIPAPLANSSLELPVVNHPEQAATTTNLLSWSPWLMGAYVVGVMVMLLRLLHGLWQNYRLAAYATPVASGPLVESLQRLTHAWSLRMAPALAFTERVIVPQVVGLWRPTILLPTAALAGLRPDELEMILAHELAHVRRYDLWINLVQRLAEAVLFFNPAVWYLSRQVSLYREYCCDEATCRLARQTEGDTRFRYAEALLRAVELAQGTTQGHNLAALAANNSRPSELRRRVARLFGEPLREPVRITRTGLVTLLVGSAVLVMIPLARQNAAELASEAKPAKTTAKPTVEVVAIGTHDEEPQRWWDAEGKSIESVPFEWKDANNISSQEKTWRRIVFRIDALPNDAEITWNVIGGGSWGDATAIPHEAGKNQTYFARYVGLAEKGEALKLRVGIASGPWVTSVKGNGLQANGILGTGIIFSGAFPKDDGCVLVLSHNLHAANVRVVAIDKAGKLVVSDSVNTVNAAGGLNQMHWVFNDLKPSDVDHFEFQTREYEWTEIDNLPVEPGSKTVQTAAKPKLIVREVTVLTSEDDIKRAQSDRRTNVMNWSPREGRREVISWRNEAPLLTEADVAEAKAVASDLGNGRFDIQLKLTSKAGERFTKETERLLKTNANGAQLAIIFDHQVLMTPRLMSVIHDTVVISGQFDEAEAEKIAELIRTEINNLPVEPGEKVAIEPPHKDVNREVSPGLASQKVAALEELRASYEAMYERTETLHNQGLAGGEPTKKWLALYHLSMTRAELAIARGETAQALQHYDKAIEAADEMIHTAQELHKAGRGTSESVFEGEVLRTKVKLAKIEAQEHNSRRGNAGEMDQGNLPASKQDTWATQLRKLTDHNQTAFSIGPQMIAELSPQEAWEVVQVVWPEIKIDEVKTGLLKTFEFARHPKVLDVLDLGATDDSKFVREYAYSYLQNYAFRDFRQPGHEYQRWRDEFAGKTTDEVLAANCQWFVDQLRNQQPITDPMAWQEVEMMLELSGSKSSYPQKAEYLRKAGLPEVLRLWRDDGELDERMKRSMTTFLGQLDKTLNESLSYVNVDLSGRNLEGLVLQGNVDSLFMNADLSKVNLRDATVVGGKKAFSETIFTGADLTRATLIGRAAFQSANFANAVLQDTNLKGENSGFQNSNFADANLQSAQLIGGGAAFQRATFRNADLQGARLQGGGSSFQFANFDNAKLTGTEINCSGSVTAFQVASLNNTDFSQANLSSISSDALASCKFDASTPPRYDDETKFPERFNPVANGWKLIE